MDSDVSPRRQRILYENLEIPCRSYNIPCPMKIQGGKTNEQKENRMAIRQTVEKAVIRDEQNRRIQFAATNPIKEVLKTSYHTSWLRSR